MTVAGAIIICLLGSTTECTTYNKKFETIEYCEKAAIVMQEEVLKIKGFEYVGHVCVDTKD